MKQQHTNIGRRSFLKTSGSVVVGLSGLGGGVLDLAGQEALPKGTVKEFVWGFVVKATPETTDPNEVAKIKGKDLWRPKKGYPFESRVLSFSQGEYRGKAYYKALGSGLTKDFKISEGVGELEFGGTVKIELLKASSKDKWEDIDTAICKMTPRKWVLINRADEVPKIRAPEAVHCETKRQSNPLRNGNVRASVELGQADLSGHFVMLQSSRLMFSIGKEERGMPSVGVIDGNGWSGFKFVWNVVLRRTTIFKDQAGKELRRERKDFSVEEMEVDLNLVTMAGRIPKHKR